MSKSFASLIVMLILFVTLPGATLADTNIQQYQTIEGITEYRLKNGLQLLLFPDQSQDKITINVTYRVGSKHENYGETGMAHLLEHLVFKGSPRHTNIAKEITDHGAQANGSTWLDRTNYYETVNATRENLEWALDLESDRMVNSFIAQKDLDSEMTVVRNEFERGENSPGRVLFERMVASAYDWHNYANTTIGSKSDIENVKIENLQAFYKRYYRPDNATLIIAGKFEPTQVLKLVDKYFSPIKNPGVPMPELYTRDPVQDGERSVTLRRAGSTKQLVSLMYRAPSGLHKDHAPLAMMTHILGVVPAGRLHNKLVESKLATSTWTWAPAFQDPYILALGAEMSKDADLDDVESELLTIIESIAATPFTNKELERVKRKFAKGFELSFNSPQKIAIALSNWIGMGDWRMMFLHRDRVEAVTLDDVHRVAQHYLKKSNRTIGRFIPTDEPDRAVVSEPANLSATLAAYKGRAEVEAGEAFEATPANILKRNRTVVMDNVKLSMLPLKTRGQSVHLQMQFGIGNEKALRHQRAIAMLTGSMLMRGSQHYTRQELKDELDRLKSSGYIGGGSTYITVQFETIRSNVLPLIRLAHEVLTTPNFDKKEFELLKEKRIESLKNAKDQPNPIAFNAYARSFNTYPKGHIFYARTFDEMIAQTQKVKHKQLKKFYQKFYGGNDTNIGLVGDFDAKKVQALIKELFVGWESKTPYQEILDAYQQVERQQERFQTPDKKNSIVVSGINFDMNLDSDDTPAMKLASHILGGGFISSRLASRIRQQEGLSYSVRANSSHPARHNNASFRFTAISAPQNTDKVIAVFKEEIHRAIKEGFTEQELADAKKSYIDSKRVSLQSNANLVKRLVSDLKNQKDMAWEAQFLEKIEAVSLDKVNAVVKKYLDPEAMTIISAGDFSGVDSSKEK